MGIVITTSKKIKDLEHEISCLKQDLINEQGFLNKKIEKMKVEHAQEIRDIEERAKKEIVQVQKEADLLVIEAKKQVQEKIAEIENERNKSFKEIKDLKEHIESRRHVLETASEKSLLVDVIMALEGYGSRLDRLEDRLSINVLSDKIEDIKDSLNKQVAEISLDIGKEFNIIEQEIKEKLDIQIVVDKLEDVNNKIDSKISKLTNDLENKINKFNIVDGISDIREKVDNIDGVKQLVKSISDRIGSSGYDFDTLMYYACEAKANSSNAASWAEGAKYAAEEAKYACESRNY